MSFWGKIAEFFGYELVRARDEKGRYVADDKSTPDVNEAYVDGKTPKRKPRRKAAPKKATAKKAPAKRGRPKKQK